jgi:hypothetical protein
LAGLPDEAGAVELLLDMATGPEKLVAVFAVNPFTAG